MIASCHALAVVVYDKLAGNGAGGGKQEPQPISKSALSSLPLELILVVCGFLEFPQICRLQQASTSWNLVGELMWSLVLKRDFSLSVDEFRKPQPSPKQLYKSLTLGLRAL